MNMQARSSSVSVHVADVHDLDEARRIDGFVRRQSAGTPFHLTAWQRAIEKGCGQRAHYLVADFADGSIAGVLPLIEIRSALFGSALVSTGFAVNGGILAEGAAGVELLIDQAIALAGDLRIPSLELRGGALPLDGWQIDDMTYLGFARSLAENDEAELAAIPRKQRAEVRRALGFGLEVVTGKSREDRDDHYAVYAESVRNLGTPVFPRSLFDAVLDEFGEAADILTVRREGSAIASVLSLYHRECVLPYWGGGTADARTWRANDLMYYALMNHARNTKGCKRFDFGRSKAGTGPAAFKRNWGFEGEHLSYAKLSLDGRPVREINPLSAKYRLQVALWQRLPLALANRFGPSLSRGLG